MTLLQHLETYHQLEALSVSLYRKAGMRLLLSSVRQLFSQALRFQAKTFVDATGGVFAVQALESNLTQKAIVVESSRATLRCLQKTAESLPMEIVADALWHLPKGRADVLFLLPSTDKGNARVEAELAGACNALEMKGVAYIVMHKDQGAKRYETLAKTLFGELEVMAKEAGWRLSKVSKQMGKPYEVRRLEFDVLDLKLQAEPGVYAAGKLDAGTDLLLESFDMTSVAGKRVLDLGCGYGLLSLKAALVGADVTALDDDLLAVRSTYHNAQRYGLDIRCLHSDVDSELHDEETFDIVLMNPPFHIGKQVVLEVPRAFIAAAYKHLTPGGELVLVANQALAYEPLLEHFAFWEVLSKNQHFKVLRAIR